MVEQGAMMRLTKSEWSVIGATLVGAALRLYQLGTPSLWADETGTYLFASLPFRQGMMVMLADAVHPPLFYYIERLVLLVTRSEFGLRWPAAMAGLLAIPLAAQFARGWSSREAGPIAAWLTALNPFAVWYAREARNYSLSLCLTLTLAWSFAALYRRPTRLRWIAFVGLSTLAYLTHYFTVLFPLACSLFLIMRLRHDYLFFRKWMLAQFVAAALASPWFILWALNPIHSFGIEWIPRPTLGDLPLTLFNLATGWSEKVSPGGMVTGVLWFGSAFLSLRRRAWHRPRWRLMTVVWVMVPLVAVFLFSLKRPVYADRYFIVLLPPLLVLAATGFTALPRPWRTAGPLALFVSLSLTSLTYITSPTFVKEDWRGAVTFLDDQTRSPNESRLLILADWISTHYYDLDLVDVNHQPEALPDSFWLVVHDLRASNHRFLPFDPPIVVEEIPPLTDWLASSGYTVQERRDFVGVVLLRVARASDS
jgi:4-amino-4-deoxy-L-arabinose transferase-like glycosyltransferase